MAASKLEFGHGSALWNYWTKGEGLAKWSGAVHKWRALRALLLKAGVPAHSVDGLATNIIMAVMPGYMKLAHAKAGKHDAGRPGVDRANPKPYGNVKYADPKNGKYPIDTAAHAKAAWSYINQADNAAKYPMNGVTLSEVKARIKAACRKFGIQISQSNSAPLAGEAREDTGNLMTAPASGLDAAARQYCAAQGWAMLDGSYPVRPLNMHGADDLDAAIAAVNASAGAHDGVRRHIMRRAAALGLASRVPASWGNAGNAEPEEANSGGHAPDIDVVRSGSEMTLKTGGAGLGTLTGRFSEFGRWYPVSSKFEGNFLERVSPGATVDTIRDDLPSMRVLFDHGTDHQIGNKVLGPIETLEEKDDGPRYEVPLFDTSYNRDLLPGLKAGVYGASMRMRVQADTWDDDPPKSGHNPDRLPERTITRMKVMEFGPVTFPANPGASAGVRSGTDEFYGRLAEVNPSAAADACRAAGITLENFTGRERARSGPGGKRMDVQPGNGVTSPSEHRKALRDRAWRMRRQPA